MMHTFDFLFSFSALFFSIVPLLFAVWAVLTIIKTLKEKNEILTKIYEKMDSKH